MVLPGFPTAITRSVTTSAKAAHPLLSFGRTQEPSKDKLIYSGPLSSLVRLVKFFSLSTSIISSGLLAALLMGGEGGAMTIVAGGISSVMICTPVILHWFTKGYITRLYYDYPSKTYTACTYDFFLTDAKTEFKRSDISLPSVSNVISSFSIRGKPVLVDPRGFLNPNHYNHLMGYTDTEGNVTLEEAKKAFESASNDPESKS
ncbi:transmembrane protein 70, mitochondrial-like [Diadema setosum]|uniref:transmembrane protein 70, mitochondrial-like n=1 Tax=Diadema setosum TaxID=31175 RepID=UPI003B3BDF26